MPRRTRPIHRISAFPDVTPLVNVALVVLIIFMIVIPTLREGVLVETPQAEQSVQLASEAEGDVVISLREDGSLFVNLKRVSWNTLGNELAIAYRGKETHPVIIKGADTLSYESILRIMEACRDVGAPGVELVAKKKDRAAPQL